jgi:hypothetical protein
MFLTEAEYANIVKKCEAAFKAEHFNAWEDILTTFVKSEEFAVHSQTISQRVRMFKKAFDTMKLSGELRLRSP